MSHLTEYHDRLAEIENAKMSFANRIAAIKAARAECVEKRVEWMMAALDYSKHDRRNSPKVVKSDLTRYYTECLDSVVTPEQFDDMFAHWSPYTGTY